MHCTLTVRSSPASLQGIDVSGIVEDKNWREFEIGDVIDACDNMGKWYESTVCDVKEDKIFVHFEGWSSKWDEWLPKASERMAKLRTHTLGRYVAKDWSRSILQGAPDSPGVVGLRQEQERQREQVT